MVSLSTRNVFDSRRSSCCRRSRRVTPGGSKGTVIDVVPDGRMKPLGSTGAPGTHPACVGHAGAGWLATLRGEFAAPSGYRVANTLVPGTIVYVGWNAPSSL